MKAEPQPSRPIRLAKTAAGTAERYLIVLVEAHGVLGALIAERRGLNDRLEKVVYYRSLLDEPYAKFIPRVDFKTIDGYFVAQDCSDGALFFEPSLVPYEIVNISEERYWQFIAHITSYDAAWVNQELTHLFSLRPGFAIDPLYKLVSPEDYASGLDQFIASHSFVYPGEPKGKGEQIPNILETALDPTDPLSASETKKPASANFGCKRLFQASAFVLFGIPLLLIIYIFVENLSVPSQDKIQSDLAKNSASKSECIRWLSSLKQHYTESPLEQPGAPSGRPLEETKGAASSISVQFRIRGEILSAFYSRRTMYCYLYFDHDGKLVHSETNSIYYGL